MEQTAAIVAAVLLAGVAVVQVLLAAGRPWGHLVYGGRATHVDGVLASPWRIASGAAAVVLLGMAWVLLASAGVAGDAGLSAAVLDGLTWAVAAFLALNTLGNLTAPSRVERWGMGSVTLVACALSVVVATT